MSLWVMMGIAIGLGMDAFAVAVATGVKLCRVDWKQTARMSLAFGIFQTAMTVFGWWGTQWVAQSLQKVGQWVAFFLLLLVGVHMILESRKGGDTHWKSGDPTQGWTLIGLAVATSIDAFAVGAGFSILGSPVFLPSVVIGLTAFSMTLVGLKIGCRFGLLLGERMEFLGGLILIGIGLKILLSGG